MNEPQKKFWSMVNKKGPKPPDYAVKLFEELKRTRCWEWVGSKNKNGYGTFSFEGKTWLTHRLSYAWKYGKQFVIGFTICHKCDNTSCVNPIHLWHGDAKMNGMDMAIKGRSMRSNFWN